MSKEIIFRLEDGKYFLYNKEGERIASDYDFIHFEGDTVLVSKYGKVKKISVDDFVNKLKKIKRANKFETIKKVKKENMIEIENGLNYYAFKEDTGYGVCDEKGNVLIEPMYDNVERFTGMLYGKFYECYNGKNISLYDEKTMKKCFDFEYTDSYTSSNQCAIFCNGDHNIYYDFKTSKIMYNDFKEMIAVKILYKEGPRSHRFEDEKCCSILFFDDKRKGQYYRVYDTDNHEDITDKCKIKIGSGKGFIKYRNDTGAFKGEIAEHDWFSRGRRVLFPFGTWWEEKKSKTSENTINKHR